MSASIFYAGKSVDVTPHASNANVFDCLFIGTGGDVEVKLRGDADDTSTIFLNVPDGAFLPVRTVLVLAAGTSAENILGLTLTA